MPRWLRRLLVAGLLLASLVYGFYRGATKVPAESGPVISRAAETATIPDDVTPPVFVPVPAAGQEPTSDCGSAIGPQALRDVEQAATLIATFPSVRPTEEVLAKVKPLVTPEYYTQLEESWGASTSPVYRTQGGRVLSCKVSAQNERVQQFLMTVAVQPEGDIGDREETTEFPLLLTVVQVGDRGIVIEAVPPDIPEEEVEEDERGFYYP